MKSIRLYKLIEGGILCQLLMFPVYLVLTSCSNSFYVSKTNLPPSGGNYVIHSKNGSFPPITNGTVTNDTISGKVNFSEGIVDSVKKYQVYVYNDSSIKVNSDVINVPLENVEKISLEIPPISILKKNYNPRSYFFSPGDPYNPTTAGFASFLICGLGQGVTGSGGRGLLFYAGYAGCICEALGFFGKYSNSHEGEDVKSLNTSGIFILGAIFIDIWSIIDAARIAKIKNLFLRSNSTHVSLNNNPQLNTNKHYESGDPYNPGVDGLASLILPGLGQILAGEPTRGLFFLGGFVGLKIIKSHTMRSQWGSEPHPGSIKAITYLLYGYHILSMLDAYHVAQRNNMIFRDKHKVTYNLKLQPYFGSLEYFNLTRKIPVGMTFLINF